MRRDNLARLCGMCIVTTCNLSPTRKAQCGEWMRINRSAQVLIQYVFGWLSGPSLFCQPKSGGATPSGG
jgi:hypothetical protein